MRSGTPAGLSLPEAPRRDLADTYVALASRPFFVVGCERSGTTLLRLILNTHPLLAVPPESPFILESRGGLGRLRSLRRELGRILRHPRFATWDLAPESVRALAATCPPTTYGDLVRIVYAAYAQAHGKVRWGDKTPRHAMQIPHLLAILPDAQFIHLIRDGRAVTASLVAQPWGPPRAAFAARIWRQRTSAALRGGRPLGPDRYHELRLEELISEPERVLGEVCRFLQIPFEREMLAFHRTAEARRWAVPRAGETDHRHLTQPLTSGLRDWRGAFGPAELEEVEAAAHPLLSDLGYVPVTTSQRWPWSLELAWTRWQVDVTYDAFLRRWRGARG